MVNLSVLVGNLGSDPEVRDVNGTTVCNFRMATSKKFKNREGELQEDTQWHNIEVWGNQADACGKYLRKGRQVFVRGETRHRQYEDENGNTKYFTSVRADTVQFLGGKGGGSESDSGGGEEIPF